MEYYAALKGECNSDTCYYYMKQQQNIYAK